MRVSDQIRQPIPVMQEFRLCCTKKLEHSSPAQAFELVRGAAVERAVGSLEVLLLLLVCQILKDVAKCAD